MVLVLALVGVWFFRGVIAGAVIERVISSQLHATTHTKSVSLSAGGGTLVIDELRIRAKGIEGDGAEALFVERLTVKASLRGLLFGGGIKEISLEGPRLRISQSVVDGKVNVGGLVKKRTKPSSPGTPPESLPKMVVSDGRIELGEHDGSKYAALKVIQVEGLVEQTEGAPGESVIRFRQVAGGTSEAGLLDISGRYSQEGLALSMGSLSLADLKPETLPTAVRESVGRLGMEGEIQNAEFRYGFAGAFTASFDLKGVALSLPLKPNPMEDHDGNILPLPPEVADRQLQLTGVSGKVSFTEKGWKGTLVGMAEELPYEVEIDWRGNSLESPFDITLVSKDFDLKEVPRVLAYAPGVAQLRFQQFGNPTATVDAVIKVFRGSPTPSGPDGVHSSGRILLRNASAAFHKFPYRFYNLKGEVTFDSTGIRIVHLEGNAPNGATVVATGTLIPPKNPKGEIDVVVKGLPVTEDLRVAMKKRGSILDEVFSETQYERLLKLGVIRKPGTPGTAPEFAIGGVADVTVKVIRFPMANGDGDWHDHITIAFQKAQILPRAFPYPVLGEGFVVQKDDDIAVVSGGKFRGLVGGDVRLAARVDFAKLEAPDAEFVPDLEVSATKIPLTPLLLAALPEARDSVGDGRTLGGMLGELNAVGTGDAEIRLSMSEDGQSKYDIDVALAGVSASPNARGDGVERIELSDLKGTVKVTRDHVSASLQSDVRIANDPTVPGGIAPAGNVGIRLSTPIRSEGTAPLKVQVVAENLRLQAPMEDVIAVFSPNAAASVDRLRGAHRPIGVVDGSMDLTLPKVGPGEVLIRARPQASSSLTLAGSRADVASASGEMVVRFDARDEEGGSKVGSWVEFSEVAMELAGGAGSLRADGRWWITAPPNAEGGRPISATLTNARFEYPLVRAIAAAAGGSESFAKTLNEYDPVGAFSAAVAAAPGNIGDPVVTISPTSLAITSNAVRIDFPTTSGSLAIQKGDGRFNSLKLNAADWSGTLDGGWLMQADRSIAITTTLSLASTGIPSGLRAILPPAVTALMKDIELSASGPIALDAAQLSWTLGGDGATKGISFGGPITFAGLAADVGVNVAQAAGRADIVYAAQDGLPASYDVRIGGDSARAAGVSVTDFRTRITSGTDGEVMVPLLTANVHGGRVSGDAVIRAPRASGTPDAGVRVFETSVTASGIRFASLLADLAVNPAAEGAANGPVVDDARGQLDANLTLKGKLGDAESRRGRGTITIGGGRVISIPLVVPLVRVANFQFPSSEGLNFAMVEFFVEGGVISVEQIAVESESVGLYGYGTALWPSQELDLRFRSRSRSRIPVVSDVLESLRGEIVTAVVRGTLKAPSVSVSTFAGTTRFLGRVVGQEPSEQQKRLEQIERQHRGAATPTMQQPVEDVVEATPE